MLKNEIDVDFNVYLLFKFDVDVDFDVNIFIVKFENISNSILLTTTVSLCFATNMSKTLTLHITLCQCVLLCTMANWPCVE